MEMQQGWPDASCALAWPLRAATGECRAGLGAVPLQHSGVPSWAIGPFGSHAAEAVGNVAGRWQAELGPSLERTRRPTRGTDALCRLGLVSISAELVDSKGPRRASGPGAGPGGVQAYRLFTFTTT